MLNINWSLVEAEISNSYCDGNYRRGCVANGPHLLHLYGNRLPGAEGLPHQGADEAKSQHNIVTESYIRLPADQVFFLCLLSANAVLFCCESWRLCKNLYVAS